MRVVLQILVHESDRHTALTDRGRAALVARDLTWQPFGLCVGFYENEKTAAVVAAYLHALAYVDRLQMGVPVRGDYFAAAGKAGSLPMSRRSCWMITVAWRFAAIFFIRSSDATVCARS